MTHCQTVRDGLPWYVSGRLAPTKMTRMATHIQSCRKCQQELAQIVQLRHGYVSAVDNTPTPADRVWETMASTLPANSTTHIDVGSFLIGVNFGFTASNRRSPIQGNLNVLGHKVRLIGKRKKGA